MTTPTVPLQELIAARDAADTASAAYANDRDHRARLGQHKEAAHFGVGAYGRDCVANALDAIIRKHTAAAVPATRLEWQAGSFPGRYTSRIPALGWGLLVILCDDDHWYFDLYGSGRERTQLHAATADDARNEAEQIVRGLLTQALAEAGG
jgi:hypothetical protein